MVNLVAPVNQLGYGVVGYNILKSLLKLGHKVSYFPIGAPQNNGDKHFNEMVKMGIDNAHFYNPKAPSVRIWHQFELDLFPGKGPRFGWPIFELNKFNERELHHLKSVDALIVCSKWAKSVIEQNGIETPTFVVPLGVDQDIFKVVEEERSNRPYWAKNSTVFINVGKWEKRKGHEELIAAFVGAFKPGDDVELWMINENPFIGSENDEWKKKYINTPMGPHIKFFDRLESQEQMRQIFSHVDCGVFPSHAEGWNLEIPELMACGAHIIATNYSGHTEFLNSNNALLLEPTGKELANDGKWFHGQGEWCTFSLDELVSHMRKIHELKQSNKLGLNEAGMATVQNLTWDLSAGTLYDIINS